MNDQQNPFGGKNGLLAIVVIAVFFFFWQSYMAKSYPQPARKAESPAAAQSAMSTKEGNETPTSSVTNSGVINQELKATDLKTREKLLPFQSSRLNFSVTNIGMGLKAVTLNTYTDRSGKPIRIGDSDTEALFEIRRSKDHQPIVFDVITKAPGHFIGTAEFEGATLVRELKFDEAKHSFSSSMSLKNASPQTGIEMVVPERIHTPQGSSFLFPSYEHQDFYINHGGKSETMNFSSAKQNVSGEYNGVQLVSIASQYFASAVLDQSDIAPDLRVEADMAKKEARAFLNYVPVQASSELKLSQIFFIGPKSIETLEAIHKDLPQIINFGSLTFIAKPMLLIMKAAFEFVANWGLAIIILTLIVRLAVFPLYLMSTRSMKAMQKIQPMIQALREKYKDDPMTMNREMMALMKEHKANPLGGCLPMLLQIPIFFALFRVIGSSVELYQAPFMFWIQDLSLHDRFFVLPVLMGVTMFVQQKITPTTMDPAQAKVLAFMPILFSVFMLYLPSGLTLYMFVSAVFGILQQMLIMRDRSKPVLARK